MNSLSFDDPSLDGLDPTLSLHDQSDIDTALLSDIDGKKTDPWRVANLSRLLWLAEALYNHYNVLTLPPHVIRVPLFAAQQIGLARLLFSLAALRSIH